jgi:ethanolamine permease
MTANGPENSGSDGAPLQATSGAGSLGVVKLVGLGVSLAVAGSFGPWGFGIGLAGWAGMLLAFLLVGLFYLCLLWCLADLSGRISEPGGGQAFAARAFGPFGRVLAGGAASVEFLFSTAVLGALTAIYAENLTGISPSITVPALFAVVVALYLRGVGEAIGITFVLSTLTLIGVVTFVSAQGAAIERPALAGAVWSIDPVSVWQALPFAVPFFIGIEGVPLASADAINPARDIPRAMLIALALVTAFGLSVLIAGPLGAGVAAISGTADTMLAALAAPGVEAPAIVRLVVNLAGLAGLCASFLGIVYACSRQFQAMALAGDFPRILSRTNGYDAPVFALVVPGCVAASLALLVPLDQLIVITVAGALIFYLVTIAAYVALRRQWPVEDRGVRGKAAVLVGTVVGLVIFSSSVASALPVLTAVTASLLLLGLYRARHLSAARRRPGSI